MKIPETFEGKYIIIKKRDETYLPLMWDECNFRYKNLPGCWQFTRLDEAQAEVETHYKKVMGQEVVEIIRYDPRN